MSEENTAPIADNEGEKKTPVFENNEKTNELLGDQKSLEELKLQDSPTKTTEVDPKDMLAPSVATAREQEEVKEEYQDVIEESIRRAEELLANESP